MLDRDRDSHRPDSVVRLAQLVPGQRATVVDVSPDVNPAVTRRLQQLGFRRAARVDVLRRAPLGDPTIYRVCDTELCIRRREAFLIEVIEVIEEADQ